MNLQTTTPEMSSTPPAAPTRSRAASLPTLAKHSRSQQTQEVLESILWRLDSKSKTNDTLAIGLSGCTNKSGTTSIATALALQASEQHRGRVLLVDANWQLPGLKNVFGLAESHGLYDILSGELAPRECEPQTISEYLDILPRGNWREAQPTSARQDLVNDLVEQLRAEYSLVVVDLPPAEQLRSALPLARALDGLLLIAPCEAIKQSQARRALSRLREDGVEVWGSVLNRHRQYVPKWLQNWL